MHLRAMKADVSAAKSSFTRLAASKAGGNVAPPKGDRKAEAWTPHAHNSAYVNP